MVQGDQKLKGLEGMESVGRSKNPLIFTTAQLNLYTNNFDEENYIGLTQFGKLYRGKIPHGLDETGVQNVTVKKLEQSPWLSLVMYYLTPADSKSKLRDEVYFLQHPSVKNHPNLVKLIGYCCEGGLFAVVYDLDPLDTLHNLIFEGSFDWLRRIKVALGFARLIAFLHDFEFPYMVRNIDAAHIMIDKDFNPILLDFGMLSGGVIGDMENCPHERLYGSLGYIDPYLCSVGGWSVKCDVYSYGVVVLSMIAKRLVYKTCSKEAVDKWAMEEFKPEKCSLVHKSLEEDPNYDACDGPKITELAVRCFGGSKPRPTMKEIVEVLQDLQAVRKHSEAGDIKTILPDA